MLYSPSFIVSTFGFSTSGFSTSGFLSPSGFFSSFLIDSSLSCSNKSRTSCVCLYFLDAISINTFVFNFFDKSSTSNSTTLVSFSLSSLNTFASTNTPSFSVWKFLINELLVSVTIAFFLPFSTFNTPGFTM